MLRCLLQFDSKRGVGVDNAQSETVTEEDHEGMWVLGEEVRSPCIPTI